MQRFSFRCVDALCRHGVLAWRQFDATDRKLSKFVAILLGMRRMIRRVDSDRSRLSQLNRLGDMGVVSGGFFSV